MEKLPAENWTGDKVLTNLMQIAFIPNTEWNMIILLSGIMNKTKWNKLTKLNFQTWLCDTKIEISITTTIEYKVCDKLKSQVYYYIKYGGVNCETSDTFSKHDNLLKFWLSLTFYTWMFFIVFNDKKEKLYIYIYNLPVQAAKQR